MTRRSLTLAVLLFALSAGVAQASWYDDYDAGLAAVRAGNWSVVAAKMSAAIKAQPNENNKARTYGMDFRNYHPYYYRGAAYLNLGKYEQAIADLEKTGGPGPESLGSVDSMLERAKKQLAASAQTEPEPVPTPVKPPVATPVNPTPTPVTPSIDPALRQRAQAALNATKQKLQAAQQRRAGSSPQYTQATSMYTDALTRNASARNNDDLNAVIAAAESAADLADLATPPNVPAPTPIQTPVPTPIVPKPVATTTMVMEDTTVEVRRALENYFAGEFEDASRQFDALTRKMPTNAWIWAFLGASQYSQYAFEADESYRTAALRSFKRAKSLRTWNGGLPSKYFSKKIRKAFGDAS
jgi:tetratricopeptide (TPR) repeat protein